MSGFNARLLRFACCAGMFMACAGVSPHAFGLSPPTSIQALADIITDNFSLTETTARPAADWCVQIETDPTQEWWQFYDKDKKTEYYQSLYGSRIKLFYNKNDNATIRGFASIFLAIDLGKKNPYYDILSQPSASASSKKTLGIIEFPPSTSTPNTICPKFSSFLEILFNNNFRSWKPTGEDPEYWLQGCDPGDPANCHFVTWNFNGRDHRVSGTILFPIEITFSDDPTEKPTRGHLIIGFGGNGGPG